MNENRHEMTDSERSQELAAEVKLPRECHSGHHWPEPLERYRQAMEQRFELVLKGQQFMQRMFLGLICAGLIMGAGVSVFFYKQMRIVRQQLAAQRAASSDSLRDFRLRIEPDIHRFAARLQSFSATNTDFRPILDLYQPKLARYFSTFVPTIPSRHESSN